MKMENEEQALFVNEFTPTKAHYIQGYRMLFGFSKKKTAVLFGILGGALLLVALSRLMIGTPLVDDDNELAYIAVLACAALEALLYFWLPGFTAKNTLRQQQEGYGQSVSLKTLFGEDGVSVTNVLMNESGDLIFSLSNGSSINSGNLLDLILSHISMNEKGELCVTPSDGNAVSIGSFIDVFLANGSEEFRALYYGSGGSGTGSWNGNEGGTSRPIPFYDVTETAYYYDAVVWAYENDITKGTSGTTFSPLSICTRAQVITFLWRAAGQPEPTTGDCPFEDVKETDYFYAPVLWAVGQGIAAGTTPTTFSPKLQCSNSHILTFLYRAVGEPGKTGTGRWYSDAWKWAEDSGLLKGTYSGSFAIEDECPRCNVTEYLYRYLSMR